MNVFTSHSNRQHHGCVDGSDLALLLGAWGACVGACPADLNCDGIVDGEDLAILLAAWGPCDGFECDPGDPPSMETITSTEQGNFVPLYAWLVNSGQTELALQLATNPGLVE